MAAAGKFLLSIAGIFVGQNPVAHCLSEEKSIKGKFCNVCRKKIHEAPGLHCEVCDYFIHDYCQEFAVPNCVDGATYDPWSQLHTITTHHNNREGNLPAHSKCFKCKKACWSPDCLTGMRCCWCGLTAHSSCVTSLAKELNLTEEARALAVSDDWSSTVCGESVAVLGGVEASKELEETMHLVIKTRDEKRKEKSTKEKEKETEEELIKVFDGYNSLRKRLFRTITVNKYCTKEELLAAAMKAFVVSQDSKNFYLLDVYADCDSEREVEIQDPHPVQSLVRKEGRRPAILLGLRDSENDSGIIKVWARKLQVGQTKIVLTVNASTTTEQVIEQALTDFGLEDNPDLYELVKVTLDCGRVTETVLNREDIPWEVLKRRGFESVRLMELTRFYLQLLEDPHGPDVALFVGNLPQNLSHKNYETILLDCLDPESKFSSLGPIYYEYGSMVITFDNSTSAIAAYEQLQGRVYEDKKLMVIMLPTLEPEMIPSKTVPLLVFVNVKSGGCQGLQLISSFRKLLNPYQVFDLSNGGPLPGLYVFRKIVKYRILVCGGDGTIGWVLQCLDNVGQDSQCSNPPCAIVPLGTGNDLARVLRWGSGYSGDEDPLSLLRDVIEAEEIRLDRWTVVFRPLTDEGAVLDGGKAPVVSAQTNENNAQIFVMNNYFGLGLDADLCLDFHNAREEKPEKFNSRNYNKGVYVKVSLRKMVGRKMCKDLHKVLKLEVDGVNVELPPIEGIIILNIMSWGSGANPWGPEKDDRFSKPNHWDGNLEVVGVTGTVDGEPWIQPAGDIVVLKSALKATMLKKQKYKVKRRNTAPPTNLPTTPIRAGSTPIPQVPQSAPYISRSHHLGGGPGTSTVSSSAPPTAGPSGSVPPSTSPPLNLADLCDSPTHATAV